ncbi:MAG: hypothetical protein JJ974_06280 [Phycisphaerales bacterium]|nr:hypothetical protein [Phycisphaerales bacterium]
MPTLNSGTSSTIDRFQIDTSEAVGRARNVYAQILEQKCPGSKAVTSVADAFGIHRKLAWQIIRVAYADDPFVAAKHMPSKKSIEAWVKAAKSKGVSGELIDSIRNASDGFQSLIETHASTKTEFDLMIDSATSGSDIQIERKWRQQAFEGNSFIWGAHCKVLMSLSILMPSEDREHFFHAAQIRGLIGFHQTRPNTRWVVSQSLAVDDDSKHEQEMQRLAIDPQASERFSGVPVLPEFCSDPMPELERTLTPEGMMQDEFLSDQIGLQGERSLVTGEILRNIAPTHAMPNDKIAHFGSGVRTPCELLHYDLFVHTGLFGEVERELKVFSDIASPYSFRESDELQVGDTIKRLGMGISMAQSPDIPGYTELARNIFDRLDRKPDDFELYRIRMPYPPVPSTVAVKHELLPKDR